MGLERFSVKNLHPFDLELIASIENEKRHFDMGSFVTDKDDRRANCRTASCMAGHIEALRPRIAKKVLVDQGYSPNELFVDHDTLAAEIYKRVTGKECRLDFYGQNYLTGTISMITRKEAISHIKGTNRKWPQIKGEL
jgi:hypothetical protein